MTLATIDNSQRKAAKIAGLLYLVTFAIVVSANFGIAERIVVPHDAAATARNILGHELLFRINIAAFVVYSIGIVGVLSALYVTLKPVNPGLAVAAAASRLVFALLWLIAPLSFYISLRVLHADYLSVIAPDQLRALAKLTAGTGFEGYYVGLPFFALAETLTFYLFFHSRYIPRWLAVAGALSSAWCLVTGIAFIAIPNFGMNLWLLDSPMGVCELILGFWLVIKGIRLPEPMASDRGIAGVAD